MKNKILQWVVMIVSTVSLTISAQANNTPQAQTAEGALTMVKTSVSEVLGDLQQNKALYQQQPTTLSQMINEKMLPHFNERAMAIKVLGQHWRSATEQQRQDFINQFKQLILRTYSLSLLDYTDAKISYGNVQLISRNRIAKVDANIQNPDGKKYALLLTLVYKKQQWKIMDVSLEGQSVITIYHDALAEELARKTLQGVIDEYKQLNSKGAVAQKLQ